MHTKMRKTLIKKDHWSHGKHHHYPHDHLFRKPICVNLNPSKKSKSNQRKQNLTSGSVDKNIFEISLFLSYRYESSHQDLNLCQLRFFFKIFMSPCKLSLYCLYFAVCHFDKIVFPPLGVNKNLNVPKEWREVAWTLPTIPYLNPRTA